MASTDKADSKELDAFLQAMPDTQMLEVLIPDINGILRGKRIIRDEFEIFYKEGIKACGSTALMSVKGETFDELGLGTKDGDPDMIVFPVTGMLAPVPWLKSSTGQVLVTTDLLNGEPSHYDPRHVLRRAMQPLTDMGLKAVVAMELEFYLLEESAGSTPQLKLSTVPGTRVKQEGSQYAMMEDLWDCDDFLADVYNMCKAQNIPTTTAHSEFAPAQYEINLHHVDDPVTACDHALLLKRAIKGIARHHGMRVSFMAKTFAEASGCGLHVHISLYDKQGNNIFSDPAQTEIPPITDQFRHAIGGLAETMPEAMAIFAPNANSYRRLQPNSFVPLKPNWGYNHRGVALRIPVSDARNLRVEHRISGADANPYLVLAAILAGIHHGIMNKCEPGAMVKEGVFLTDNEITLPTRWETALQLFDNSKILPAYLGQEYHRLFSDCHWIMCNQFHAEISDRDYEWYLRAI